MSSLIPLYSIGHGTRPIADLTRLLTVFGIEYLADVRSKPWSAFNPQYNRPALKEAVNKAGIKYVYMGDSLGGRPADLDCYNAMGKVDYELLRQKDFFLHGIARLQNAYSQHCRLAILCSEAKPEHCHRSRLIGRVLAEKDLPLHHIDEHGKIREQAALFTGHGDLFNS